MNLVYLRVGDVIASGGAEWVVEMVNDCRARCRCLSRKMRTVRDRIHDVTRTFAGTAETMSITPRLEPDMVLRHDKNLVNANKNKAITEEQTNMKDKATSTKTDSKKTETHTGLLGGIFGHSVTSVLRRLGKEGVATAHAREIMKAQDVETSDITVSIQVNAGRRGKGGPPADLTAAQIKQLVTSAKAPEKAEPAAKPAKKGGKAAAKKDGKKAAAAKPAAKKNGKPAKASAPADEPATTDTDEEVVDAEA